MSGRNCSVPKVQGGLLKNTMYMQYEETKKFLFQIDPCAGQINNFETTG